MEEAKVVFFHWEQKFGFLEMEDGPDLFFHYNDGEIWVAGKSKPEFSGIAKVWVIDRDVGLMTPERGDTILFNRKMASQGPIASPWGFKSSYQYVAGRIQSRTRHRLLTLHPPSETKENTPETLWEGAYLLDPRLIELQQSWDDSSTFLRDEHGPLKWFEYWEDFSREWRPCPVPEHVPVYR